LRGEARAEQKVRRKKDGHRQKKNVKRSEASVVRIAKEKLRKKEIQRGRTPTTKRGKKEIENQHLCE